MNLFITGVGKGIGLALLKEALSKGAQVCGIARTPEESPDLQDLRKKFPNLQLLKLDLTDPEAKSKLLEGTRGFSSFDVVINNAGIYEKGTLKRRVSEKL